MKFSGILGILLTFLAVCVPRSVGAQQSTSSGDVVNGVLTMIDGNINFDSMISGMEGDIDFDSMLSGMRGEIDFDTMIGGMDGNRGKFKNKNPENVDKTLEYLSNVYSEAFNMSYGKGFASTAPSKYRYSGIAVLPVIGHITSNFGYRPSFKRMHHGIDISLQVGDTVRAAMDGTVTRVDVDADGYGLYVVLAHRDGLETRYGHLSRSLVISGMHIMAGDPIALGGNSGNSTGPHLHFETRRNDIAFDPTTIFDFSMPSGMTRHRNLAALDGMNPKFDRNNQSYFSQTNATDDSGFITPAALAAKNKNQDMVEKSTYIVKPGDTMTTIARQAGISMLTLCRLNMLSTTDVLTPGRMLRLR